MLDPLFVRLNQVEAGLWFAIGLGFMVRALMRSSGPADAAPSISGTKLAWIAAATFLAFGVSDLVETQTGAWWRPWWLLVWKGVCVAIFGALLVARVRSK